MPVYQFVFTPATAGCVARIVVRTPWDRQVREQPSQQFPQGRVLEPVQAAIAWLSGVGAQPDQYGNPTLLFPPQAQLQQQLVGNEHGGPQILAMELYQPVVDRQQVNAPYNGGPIPNGRQLTMPPVATKERVVPQGCYEPIHDCGIAVNQDALLGDSDPEGGTWSDIDSLGNEVQRQLYMPPSPKVTDRR